MPTLSVYLPEDLYRRIAASADKLRRSSAEEIRWRLEDSLGTRLSRATPDILTRRARP